MRTSKGDIRRFISDKVRPHLFAPNDAAQTEAFGMLARLAKPATAEFMAQAKRDYMLKR